MIEIVGYYAQPRDSMSMVGEQWAGPKVGVTDVLGLPGAETFAQSAGLRVAPGTTVAVGVKVLAGVVLRANGPGVRTWSGMDLTYHDKGSTVTLTVFESIGRQVLSLAGWDALCFLGVGYVRLVGKGATQNVRANSPVREAWRTSPYAPSASGERVVCGAGWCHNGTMKRMNLRDVPDDVFDALTSAAAANRQSLSAFVVDRLTEVAEVTRLASYMATYPAPQGIGVTLKEASAAVREVREAS